MSITAYRVVQECLTNIAKHAKAHRVVINVQRDEQFIFLNIEDDGIGFDQNRSSQGYGLAGMRERIQGLMGEIKIESNHIEGETLQNTFVQHGTKMTVKLPKHPSATVTDTSGAN